MITGVSEWDKKEHYYSQSNNPTEAFLKATINDRSSWLESCGPTAAVNCLAVMGKNVNVYCPGTYKPQPEEVLMDYFNDPRNKLRLNLVRKVDENIPKNRVPQFYPTAVRDVFAYDCSFEWGPTFDKVRTFVTSKRAVQLCLINPGHYIAVIAYDSTTEELVYNDSWGERFSDGNGGWHRRMVREEFDLNTEPYYIVYT